MYMGSLRTCDTGINCCEPITMQDSEMGIEWGIWPRGSDEAMDNRYSRSRFSRKNHHYFQWKRYCQIGTTSLAILLDRRNRLRSRQKVTIICPPQPEAISDVVG